MRVEGFIKKVIDNDITYFVAEVPSLLVVTDGDTEEEAYYMVQDAIGLMLEVHTEGKINKNNITIIPLDSEKFDVICSDTKSLHSFLLKQQRGKLV